MEAGEAGLAGEELLHGGLLEVALLGDEPSQPLQQRIHIAQGRRDGALFGRELEMRVRIFRTAPKLDSSLERQSVGRSKIFCEFSECQDIADELSMLGTTESHERNMLI